jgi:hypothetical protein
MSEGLVSDGVDGIRTTRLLERAVRERWPIPEHLRQAIIDRQVEIATDPKYDAREATSAAKTVIAADRINQQEEQGPKAGAQHLHLHQHDDGLGEEERERRLLSLLARIKERLGADARGDTAAPAPDDARGAAGG